MTRLRARIAERLVQVQATAAMLTTFNEVDLTEVNGLRARYKERFEKQHGVAARIHVLFRQGVHRGIATLSGGQRVGRRERHRLSRVLRHRNRGLDRPRSHRAGAARRRHAQLCRHRAERRRLRDACARRRDHARGTDRRDLHHHQRRGLWFAALDADPEPAAERDPRDAQDPGAPGSRRTARSSFDR